MLYSLRPSIPHDLYSPARPRPPQHITHTSKIKTQACNVMDEIFLSMFRMLATDFVLVTTGVVVGAVTERLSRRSHPHARLRNIVAKMAIAYFSVSFILGLDGTLKDRVSPGMLISFVMQIVVFVIGTVIGAALQPVGITGGIATGKSTVSNMFQSLRDDAETEFVIIDLDGIAHEILLP